MSDMLDDVAQYIEKRVGCSEGGAWTTSFVEDVKRYIAKIKNGLRFDRTTHTVHVYRRDAIVGHFALPKSDQLGSFTIHVEYDEDDDPIDSSLSTQDILELAEYIRDFK